MTSDWLKRKQWIWMLGVRERKKFRERGQWGEAWGVTSREWFYTRKQVKEYIATQIDKQNFQYYEYKPIRYRPA